MQTHIPEQELFPYRPIPFYFITSHDPAELTYERFYADLSRMKAQGYGGIIPFNRPGTGFSKELYFSELWFETIGNILRACRQLGLRVWLNDDWRAPPGTIGGRLQEIAPHLTPKRLFLEDGQVVVRDVKWGFPAFEEPESAQLFQQYTYEEYRRRFGEYFGNTIVGIFSDADSRRVNSEVLSPGSPMKDYFPWSTHFSESFKEAYGYAIEPYLPSILRREPSPQSRDYWEHSGRLYMGWFASNYQWCRRNGLEYTFHTSDSAPFRIQASYFNSAFAEGKAIDAGRCCDYPGTDHERLDLNGGRMFLRERRKDPLFIYGGDDSHRRPGNFFDVYADLRAKQNQSCAFLNDKKGVMCEMFAASGWHVTYQDLRNIAAWQLMQGVSFIVPHAYHIKLHKESKYFAPPSFGAHSYLNFGIRQLNDFLARSAWLCSRGRLAVDLALLDPTDSIWAGTGDSMVELELAKRLNRVPQGYIISDMKGLRQKADQLKAVINPGLHLTRQEREEITSLGLELLEAEELDNLSVLERRFPTGIRWEGTGELIFMRRQLEDGDTLVIVGNIECEDTLTGTLHIGQKRYTIELASGELAFFGGGLDTYRAPSLPGERLILADQTAITVEKPNIIPLLRWEDQNGVPSALPKPALRESYLVTAGFIPRPVETVNEPTPANPLFPFTAGQTITGLELLIPPDFVSSYVGGVYLDGKELQPAGTAPVFDDPYLVYPFDVTEGRHAIELKLTANVESLERLYLRGDFGAHIGIQPGQLRQFSTYLPEKAEITLTQPPVQLRTNCSWTEQGYPFYSGSVRYEFEPEIPENFTRADLVLPGVGDGVKVYWDGELLGTGIFTPYRFPLCTTVGKHRLELEVCNTFGNMLNGFCQRSGLLETPYLER